MHTRQIKVVFAAALVLLPATATTLWAQDSQRLPIPDRASQAKALESIKQLFLDEYQAKKPEVHIELAGKLLEFAPSEKDANLKFGLLREALELASKNGATETAFSAAVQISEVFQLDPLAMKAYAISKLGKSTKTPADAKVVAEACVPLAQQQLARSLYAQAATTIAQGTDLAKRARSKQLTAELRKLQQHVSRIETEYEKTKPARTALADNPEDASANLTVGIFECFVRGNWADGISYLSLGDDADLKELAIKSLANPMDATVQVEVGHAWWKYGEGLEGMRKDLTLAYAAGWYEKALPELSGITRQLATKRIEQMAEVALAAKSSGTPSRSGRSPQPNKINLLKLMDLAQDGSPKSRWAIKNGALVCVNGSFVPKMVFPYQPPTEYDVRYVYSQPKMSRHMLGISLPNTRLKTSFAAFAGSSSGRVGVSDKADKYKRSIPNYFVANRQYEVVVKVRKDSIQIIVNRQPAFQLKTDYSDLVAGSWHRLNAWQNIGIFTGDVATFYVAELTEVSGKGVMTRER